MSPGDDSLGFFLAGELGGEISEGLLAAWACEGQRTTDRWAYEERTQQNALVTLPTCVGVTVSNDVTVGDGAWSGELAQVASTDNPRGS
jgi:hypothetical protein